MAIDLGLLWSIAEKILLVGVGAAFASRFERRPRLTAFYGHVGQFRINPPLSDAQGNAIAWINTHTVVVRNSGRRAAQNVRIPHRGPLAAANIHVSIHPPGFNHTTNPLPDGSEEIVFPVLVPRQQVTLSYLYFPPITYQVINLPPSSDEGMIRVVDYLPTPQSPKWKQAVSWTLMAVGVGAIVYAAIQGSQWVIAALI